MALETKDIVAAFKRQPIPFSSGVLVLLLALLAYFRMGIVEERETKLQEADKVLVKLTNNITYSAQLDQHLSELRAVNENFEKTALKQGDLAKNQQYFYELESETGVRLVELRALPVAPPAKGAPQTFYQPLSFSLSVKGDYSKLMLFMRHFEGGETLGRIVSASLVYIDADEQTMDLMVEIMGLK